MSRVQELESRLREILEKAREWQRVPVRSSPGIFVVKAPGTKRNPPSLLIELNPVDENNMPTKRRGLYIRSRKDLEEFRNTRSDAIRAVEASVIQILKEKLDYRLEEILAPDKCDTVIHLADDDREVLTKCVGHAFGLHLHINFVIEEGQDGGSLVATIEPVEVGM